MAENKNAAHRPNEKALVDENQVKDADDSDDLRMEMRKARLMEIKCVRLGSWRYFRQA